MVFASARRITWCFAMVHLFWVSFELEKLACALSNLTLLVEHEASTENIDPAIKSDWGVTLASLHSFRASVRDPFPDNLSSIDLGTQNFFACVKVEASDQIHIIAHGSEGGALSGSWLPFWFEGHSDRYSEVLTFLHPLNVRLQTTNEFFNQLVSRDVFRWCCLELLVIIFITRFCVFVDYARLGSWVLNPLNHDLVLKIVLNERLGLCGAAANPTIILDTGKVA